MKETYFQDSVFLGKELSVMVAESLLWHFKDMTHTSKIVYLHSYFYLKKTNKQQPNQPNKKNTTKNKP